MGLRTKEIIKTNEKMENPKRKGNQFEREVAREFKTQLGDFAARNPSSGGGVNKSDVHNPLDLNLECKRVERLNIYKAIQQSERDASNAHSKPTVVFRCNRMPEPYIAIQLSYFFELLRKSKEPKTFKTENRELQYKLRNLLNASKQVLKELEK